MWSPSAALWQYHRRARHEVDLLDAVMVGECVLCTTLPPLRPELTVGFNATGGASGCIGVDSNKRLSHALEDHLNHTLVDRERRLPCSANHASDRPC